MSYFGTDGIRGKFGELPITPDFILKLGYVTGLVLIENNNNPARKPSVVIGKDTRLSGYVIEGALQVGLVGKAHGMCRFGQGRALGQQAARAVQSQV